MTRQKVIGEASKAYKWTAETLDKIIAVFIGRDGRKVAFGIWLFWVATSLIAVGKIESAHWFYCAISSALLIGFGTITDAIVAKVGDAAADWLRGRTFKENLTVGEEK